MACTYNSVTLAEGDTFVLPPGATLIAATDPAALTSENGCADDQIANLESYECYAVAFGIASEGSIDLPWPLGSVTLPSPVYESVNIEGIRINGVEYPFTDATPVTIYSSNILIKTAIDTLPFGSLIIDVQKNASFDINRGGVAYVTFKSIASIAANDMFFYGTASGKVSSPSSGAFPVDFPVLSYDNKPDAGGIGWPECSVSLG